MGSSAKQPPLYCPSLTCQCVQSPMRSELLKLFSDKYLRRIRVPTNSPGKHSHMPVFSLVIHPKMVVVDLWESRNDFWRLFFIFSQQGGKLTQGVVSLPATHAPWGVTAYQRCGWVSITPPMGCLLGQASYDPNSHKQDCAVAEMIRCV